MFEIFVFLNFIKLLFISPMQLLTVF